MQPLHGFVLLFPGLAPAVVPPFIFIGIPIDLEGPSPSSPISPSLPSSSCSLIHRTFLSLQLSQDIVCLVRFSLTLVRVWTDGSSPSSGEAVDDSVVMGKDFRDLGLVWVAEEVEPFRLGREALVGFEGPDEGPERVSRLFKEEEGNNALSSFKGGDVGLLR